MKIKTKEIDMIMRIQFHINEANRILTMLKKSLVYPNTTRNIKKSLRRN